MDNRDRNVYCTPENPCTALQTTQREVKSIRDNFDNFRKESIKQDEEIWREVNKLKDGYLPAWVSGIGWIMGVIIGILGSIVGRSQ